MLRRPETSDYRKPRTRRAHPKRTVRTLLSPEQMHHAMMRESARVDRKAAGTLSLVLFRIPAAVSKNRGARGRRSVSTVRLARTILQRIRVTDDVGWFDGEHVGVLLPDTPPEGAWRLAQEVCDAVGHRRARPLCTMYTYPAEGESESGTAAATAQGIIRTTETAIDRGVEQAPAVRVAS